MILAPKTHWNRLLDLELKKNYTLKKGYDHKPSLILSSHKLELSFLKELSSTNSRYALFPGIQR